MPRKKRELEALGIYHVYARGNNRQKIYREAKDFEFYLQLLLKAKEKYGFELYHYCLMSNHFHLLLRVREAKDLWQIMHGLQLQYSKYYKKKYKYFGHLFQGRYRSPRIPDDSYYLQCGRYIERNPVKAKMVKTPWDYEYSSARYYAEGVSDELVSPNLHYEQMGRVLEERRESYRKFLLLDEPYSDIVDEGLARV